MWNDSSLWFVLFSLVFSTHVEVHRFSGVSQILWFNELKCQTLNTLDSVVYAAADRPDKPLDAVLSACEQTFAVVTWSPAADNNAPITGFIVYYRTSHDAARTSTGGARHVGARVGTSDVSARVKLAPWTEYWFSVAAVNDVGISNRTDVVADGPCETEQGPPARSPQRVCTNSQRPDQLVIVWEVLYVTHLSYSSV